MIERKGMIVIKDVRRPRLNLIKIFGDMTVSERSIFLDGENPRIELYKVFIWADRESSYLCIKICIESTKLRGTFKI